MADATDVADGATLVLPTNVAIKVELGHFLPGNCQLMLVRVNNLLPIGGTFEVKVEVAYGTVVAVSANLVAGITKASYFDILNCIEEKKRVLTVRRVLDLTG